MIVLYKQVVSAHEFEQHAGAKTRHPNNHIYLENGKPIYSIIQELKTAPLGILEEVVKNVAGSSVNEGSFQVWKGIFCLLLVSSWGMWVFWGLGLLLIGERVVLFDVVHILLIFGLIMQLSYI